MPILSRAFQEVGSKTVVTLVILVYWATGYFVLNRLPFDEILIVPLTAVDRTPIVPWTVVVYLSVFVLCALAIWLQPTRERLRHYFASALFAYTINFALFAAWPTMIYRRALIDVDDSLWTWAIEVIRAIDEPTNCLPSLHMTNCFLAVFSYGVTRPLGLLFWLWTLAIAASTITTDQHVFWDLPPGAIVALLGTVLAGRALRAAERSSIGY